MARYALFVMGKYDAAGGLDDLKFVGDLDECVRRAEQSSHDQYAHIADLEQLKIVRRGSWRYTPKDRITGLTADRGAIVWEYEWEED